MYFPTQRRKDLLLENYWMTKQENIKKFENNIFCFDTNYVRKNFASIHFIKENNKVLIIDTGTNHSVKSFIDALSKMHITPNSVEWIILTHVHLDHAGGAGLLMQICPNAKLVLHPRGLRHMVDPQKLWSSVVAVYGQETAEQQYGKLIAVNKERVLAVEEGSTINFQGRIITFFEAPGHAKHHILIFDETSNSFFTGDAFGISYPDLINDGEEFIFISSSPTQFDPVAYKKTVNKVLEMAPKACFLTHYSKIENISKNGNELLKQIDEYVEIVEKVNITEKNSENAIAENLFALLLKKLKKFSNTHSSKNFRTLLELDLSLNAQGLKCWAERSDIEKTESRNGIK